ncbi:alpha/beta hydrolase [Actinoplanes sp. NPDC023714]|uniref:alpha/beta fold hydrolase n=1 Tax=Actinoplanes sp. NPDC023714 TaxID=3154322 RepID=UPI0033C03A92
MTIAGSFVVGALACRSRWAFLTTPLVYAVTYELVRIRATGPSVDMPHISPFGAIALVTGRGVHGLLALLPMILGVWSGRALRGRRRLPVAVASSLLVALTVAFAIPARTAPVAGGIAELTKVGGLDVMIRGAEPAKPVLLFVPGSPGGSERGAMRRHLSGLERHFVVATMDRRAFSPPDVTVDDEVADVLAVTGYLSDRFDRPKIYLMAFSGGSIPGALAAYREPARYEAYIGTGQAVDLLDSDRIFYADILAWARAEGHDDVVARLEEQGPPPYEGFWGYEALLLHENTVYDQGDPGLELGAPEYTLLRKAHALTAMVDTWDALYPRMQDVDLRRDVPRLAVPAYFLQGGEEMRGLEELFGPWYRALEAPAKELHVLPGGGHRAIFEQPERTIALLAGISGQ